MDGYERFLAERLDSIRGATVNVGPGQYRATLLLRGRGSQEIEAWRCGHVHSNPGLAFVCALSQRTRLRAEHEGSAGANKGTPNRGSGHPGAPPRSIEQRGLGR